MPFGVRLILGEWRSPGFTPDVAALRWAAVTGDTRPPLRSARL